MKTKYNMSINVSFQFPQYLTKKEIHQALQQIKETFKCKMTEDGSPYFWLYEETRDGRGKVLVENQVKKYKVKSVKYKPNYR